MLIKLKIQHIGNNYKLKMSLKRKILWLSNCTFSEEKIKATGTWIIAMGEALIKTGEVELYNISYGNTKTIIRNDCQGINQWIIPNVKTNSKGLPPQYIIDFIKGVEQEVNPDVIHIWGTESYWGMLSATNVFSKPVLLEIQGILSTCVSVFYGGLSNSELMGCVGLKEIILPQRLFYFRKQEFIKRSRIEKFIISNSPRIAVQSDWVKAHIKLENENAILFNAGILLRKEFYVAEPWKRSKNNEVIIFTSSSGSNMYKGLHVLLRAIAVLKKTIPTIKLHIGGRILFDKILQDGYSNWLVKEAKKLGIINNIEWLGSLTADEIIYQLQIASVFVVPSYVESYCLALAEAMIIGIPCVASYAGAMPELAEDKKSALFFPVGDYTTCASHIQQIVNDESIANHLSIKARASAFKKNNFIDNVKVQLAIYDTISREL